jgi:hypothetical protein
MKGNIREGEGRFVCAEKERMTNYEYIGGWK